LLPCEASRNRLTRQAVEKALVTVIDDREMMMKKRKRKVFVMKMLIMSIYQTKTVTTLPMK
jgi:hypothetical protein